VAGLTAQAAAEGAYYNVIINLPGILDEKFTKEIEAKADALKKNAIKIGDEIRKIVGEALK
jgi:glutamate formiminotransferase/formiminotetrahydrofolate cyclodeaminase